MKAVAGESRGEGRAPWQGGSAVSAGFAFESTNGFPKGLHVVGSPRPLGDAGLGEAGTRGLKQGFLRTKRPLEGVGGPSVAGDRKANQLLERRSSCFLRRTESLMGRRANSVL